MEPRELTQVVFKLAAVFIRSGNSWRWLYFIHKLMPVITSALHILSGYILFVLLDNRFSYLGYTYSMEHGKFEEIFADIAHCLLPTELKVGALRLTCTLPINNLLKFIFLTMWFIYIAFVIFDIIWIAKEYLPLLLGFEKWYVLYKQLIKYFSNLKLA